MGGIWDLKDGSGFGLFGLEEAYFAISEDPVSIWNICLKEEMLAWTKVVEYGLTDSDLVMGFSG